MGKLSATYAVGIMAFTVATIFIICGLMAESYFLLKLKTVGLLLAFAYSYLRSFNRPNSKAYSFIVIYGAWALMLFIVGFIPTDIPEKTQEYLFYLVPALLGFYFLILPHMARELGYRIEKSSYWEANSSLADVFLFFMVTFLLGIYVFQ